MKIFGSITELVSAVFRKNSQTITLRPNQTTTYTAARDVQLPQQDAASVLVSRDSTDTLTNKTLTAPVLNSPTGLTKSDVGLSNVDNTSDATKNAAVATLTNKTLTSPVINSPTGLVKGDVGLGNVDNTSDATKNAATATLTNKTLTSPVINSPTGIVKGDVGLGNVDNTSDATKNAAAVTLTNKTINGADHDFSEYNTQGSAPSAPGGAGDVRVYAQSKFLYTIDSDGVITQVGSGSGGRNYLSQDFFGNSVGTVGSGSVSDTGNRATNTMAAWQSTNTANISISSSSSAPLRETGSFLTTGSSNSSVGATFVESKGFNLDNVDLGKPVSVIFDISGSTLSTDWDVCVVRYNSSGTYQEKISIAGTASTGTPASALLPTGTTTFRGFFLASNTQTDFYALRWRRLANAVNIKFDSLAVGPFSYQVGAAMTDWIAYTPSLTGFGTATVNTGWYRRVGDSIEIHGFIDAGTTTSTPPLISLPGALTIDSAKIPGDLKTALGFANSSEATTTNVWGTAAVAGGYVVIATSANTNTVTLAPIVGSNASGNTYTVQDASANIASGAQVSYHFTAPVAQWSSNIQMADRAVEEYAINTSTSATTDTTSFGYGVGGVSFVSNTANIQKRVRFSTPILPTDRIAVEITNDGGITWIDSAVGNANVYPWSIQVSTSYGVRWIGIINNTDVDVDIGQYRANASTYGAAGSAWSGIAASTTHKWRCRKVSGGAAVGYPIATSNILGRTDGVSSAAGFLGERIAASLTAVTSTTLADTEIDVTGASLTLTPGRWAVTYDSTIGFSFNASVGLSGRCRITDSSNVAVAKSASFGFVNSTSGLDYYFFWSKTVIIDVATTTTYKLRITSRYATANGSISFYAGDFGTLTGQDNDSQFYAVRIA